MCLINLIIFSFNVFEIIIRFLEMIGGKIGFFFFLIIIENKRGVIIGYEILVKF